MSENDNLRDLGELRTYKTRSLLKTKFDFLGSNKSILHEDLDKSCLYKFSDTFVRIEYPGQVKNVEKAIETLGGIEEIEKAVEGKKLELKFNPNNQYSKGCVADSDSGVGLLVKVKESNGECSYEILGPTVLNMKFNRMCDFQYLPLVAKSEPENEESEVEYVHDKIMTDTIPSMEWFTSKEKSNHETFLISEHFARFDAPQPKFQINSADSFISVLRPDILRSEYSHQRRKEKSVVSSIRVSFVNPVEKIPDQPLSEAMKMIKDKVLQKQYSLVKSYFEERPIWRRAAILHRSKISQDAGKYVLPCVAYYCNRGPWRSCWIRFDYDPSSDYNSRIYQVLDYRIRSAEGMQLKIKAKRRLITNVFPGKPSKDTVSELDYSIKPNHLPPARQMFYQYCDILLPEVQEMLAKLPKLSSAVKFDCKNGWLPLSFQEHCREIVNNYIFEAVQKELTKDTQMQNQEISNENVTTYCSKMLSNIEMGVCQSMGQYSGGTAATRENIVDEINLSDDDLEAVDADEVVNSLLPERMPENFEDDDDDSDLEIDMEAVEEVNELVAGMKDKTLLS